MAWTAVVKNAQSYFARRPDATCDLDLVEDLVERYLVWQETSVDAHVAYRRWCDDRIGSRRCSYAAFIAALDREECAAADYRRVVKRMTVVEDATRRRG